MSIMYLAATKKHLAVLKERANISDPEAAASELKEAKQLLSITTYVPLRKSLQARITKLSQRKPPVTTARLIKLLEEAVAIMDESPEYHRKPGQLKPGVKPKRKG